MNVKIEDRPGVCGLRLQTACGRYITWGGSIAAPSAEPHDIARFLDKRQAHSFARFHGHTFGETLHVFATTRKPGQSEHPLLAPRLNSEQVGKLAELLGADMVATINSNG